MTTRAFAKTRVCNIAIIVLVSVSALASSSARIVDQTKRPDALNIAVNRLTKAESAAGPELRPRIEQLQGSHSPCPVDERCVSLWRDITGYAVRLKVHSNVTVSAQRGKGATVFYQTVAERLVDRKKFVHEMKCQTPCTQKIPIGLYFFWTERNGQITSADNTWFEIVESEEKITIAET